MADIGNNLQLSTTLSVNGDLSEALSQIGLKFKEIIADTQNLTRNLDALPPSVTRMAEAFRSASVQSAELVTSIKEVSVVSKTTAEEMVASFNTAFADIESKGSIALGNAFKGFAGQIDALKSSLSGINTTLQPAVTSVNDLAVGVTRVGTEFKAVNDSITLVNTELAKLPVSIDATSVSVGNLARQVDGLIAPTSAVSKELGDWSLGIDKSIASLTNFSAELSTAAATSTGISSNWTVIADKIVAAEAALARMSAMSGGALAQATAASTAKPGPRVNKTEEFAVGSFAGNLTNITPGKILAGWLGMHDLGSAMKADQALQTTMTESNIGDKKDPQYNDIRREFKDLIYSAHRGTNVNIEQTTEAAQEFVPRLNINARDPKQFKEASDLFRKVLLTAENAQLAGIIKNPMEELPWITDIAQRESHGDPAKAEETINQENAGILLSRTKPRMFLTQLRHANDELLPLGMNADDINFHIARNLQFGEQGQTGYHLEETAKSFLDPTKGMGKDRLNQSIAAILAMPNKSKVQERDLHDMQTAQNAGGHRFDLHAYYQKLGILDQSGLHLRADVLRGDTIGNVGHLLHQRFENLSTQGAQGYIADPAEREKAQNQQRIENARAFGNVTGTFGGDIYDANYDDVIKRARDKYDAYKEKGVEGVRAELTDSPWQRLMIVVSQINSIGTILADNTLPGVNKALLTLSNGLQTIEDTIHNHPKAGTVAGYAIEGAIGLALLGIFGKVARSVGRSVMVAPNAIASSAFGVQPGYVSRGIGRTIRNVPGLGGIGGRLATRGITPPAAPATAAPATATAAPATAAPAARSILRRSAGRLLGPGLLVAGSVYEGSQEILEAQQQEAQGKISAAQAKAQEGKAVGGAVGNIGGGLAGMWAGGEAGAALGTMIAPGIGTTIGAVAGGILGSLAGGWIGSSTGGSAGEAAAGMLGGNGTDSQNTNTLTPPVKTLDHAATELLKSASELHEAALLLQGKRQDQPPPEKTSLIPPQNKAAPTATPVPTGPMAPLVNPETNPTPGVPFTVGSRNVETNRQFALNTVQRHNDITGNTQLALNDNIISDAAPNMLPASNEQQSDIITDEPTTTRNESGIGNFFRRHFTAEPVQDSVRNETTSRNISDPGVEQYKQELNAGQIPEYKHERAPLAPGAEYTSDKSAPPITPERPLETAPLGYQMLKLWEADPANKGLHPPGMIMDMIRRPDVFPNDNEEDAKAKYDALKASPGNPLGGHRPRSKFAHINRPAPGAVTHGQIAPHMSSLFTGQMGSPFRNHQTFIGGFPVQPMRGIGQDGMPVQMSPDGLPMRPTASSIRGQITPHNAVHTVATTADVKKFAPLLDLLGKTEGTDRGRGYNETLGYGKFTGGPVDLTNMTIAEVYKLQQQMLANPNNKLHSSAVGRYQMVSGTLREKVRELGLDPNTTKFTPEIQDMLAAQDIKDRGGDKFLRGELSQTGMMKNLSKEWASIPSPDTGHSYYGQGTGASVAEVSSVLDQVRNNAASSTAATSDGGYTETKFTPAQYQLLKRPGGLIDPLAPKPDIYAMPTKHGIKGPWQETLPTPAPIPDAGPKLNPLQPVKSVGQGTSFASEPSIPPQGMGGIGTGPTLPAEPGGIGGGSFAAEPSVAPVGEFDAYFNALKEQFRKKPYKRMQTRRGQMEWDLANGSLFNPKIPLSEWQAPDPEHHLGRSINQLPKPEPYVSTPIKLPSVSSMMDANSESFQRHGYAAASRGFNLNSTHNISLDLDGDTISEHVIRNTYNQMNQATRGVIGHDTSMTPTQPGPTVTTSH